MLEVLSPLMLLVIVFLIAVLVQPKRKEEEEEEEIKRTSSKSDSFNSNSSSYRSNYKTTSYVTKPVNVPSIRAIIKKAIDEEMDIIITYRKYDGTTSQRQLSNIEYNNEYGSYGYSNDHIKGYCHLRKEYRVFRIDRITRIVLRRR